MKHKKPNFVYEDLYVLIDNLESRIETLENEGFEFNTTDDELTELTEKLETFKNIANYLEEMDKDRDIEEYNYEITYSKSFLEHASTDERLGKRMMNLYKSILKDCQWNEFKYTMVLLEALEIKLDIQIDDLEKTIKIYMTL